MKTCQFLLVLDSAIRSTSCLWFFGIRFRCGESPTFLPFKPLIMTLPAKIVNNCLPLRFCRLFFASASLTTSANWATAKTASLNKMSIKFIFRNGQSTMSEQIPWWHRSKKTRDMFLCYIQINIKKRARRGSVLQATCGIPEKNETSTQL